MTNKLLSVSSFRPLKVIRPSTKGCGSSASENRNELPANLIVTGEYISMSSVYLIPIRLSFKNLYLCENR